ncbi:MAG: UvrD-helicase domain-containing protein, partial [Acidimicrobiales bacterium]
MKMMLSDQPARELISSAGLDQTLFVQAGAGTGKTTQLVSRIVNTVLNNDVRLSEIAAITFTEAAASELQARIRVEFEKVAQAGNSTHRERAEQAIADTDLAAVSTVHGFASRILGEFSVAAGLPPRISVLDEVASQLANEQRWDRFVDLLNNEPELEELMYRAALLDVPLSPAFHGQASFKDVAHNFAQNWDRLDELLDQPLGGVLAPINFDPFHEAVRAMSTLLDDCLDPSDKLAEHIRTVLPEMQIVAAVTDPHRKLRRFQTLAARARPKKGKIWGRRNCGSKKNWA